MGRAVRGERMFEPSDSERRWMTNKIVTLPAGTATRKRRLRQPLYSLAFTRSREASLQLAGEGKDVVRSLHSTQRNHRIGANQAFVQGSYCDLIDYFASGTDIDPQRITPVLQRISADTWESDLFRLASLTWSVPVSNGFG